MSKFPRDVEEPGPPAVLRTGAGTPDSTLRVGSYNIHRCIGTDGRCDPARIAAVLDEMSCDPIGLQEVDNSPGVAPGALQLDFLAHATGMRAIAGLRIVRHLGHYGNALLTRHPVLAVRRHDLSFSWREPRGALDVDLDLQGTTARFIVTHLGLTPGERRHQMRRVLQIVAAGSPASPVVLLGDINEWLPLGRPLRWLHAVFGRPPAPPSFPAFWPVIALDRIWIRPRAALLSLHAHRSATARHASDHLPITAAISVPANRGNSC
jgi:endonuclease/exonuclease/phosphatase family metal-dependent hydrolase